MIRAWYTKVSLYLAVSYKVYLYTTCIIFFYRCEPLLHILSGSSRSAEKLSNMKVLSWNCRGVGNTTTFQRLKDLLCKYSQEFLFLSEILIYETKKNKKLSSFGFNSIYSVNPIGRKKDCF